MKVIAFYLPQFHTIPENDKWWGEGFTEWTNVKKAGPLFENHYQPREPLNDNYYNLLNIDVMKWQIEIAQKYGVYGFCFYHYWFDGHLLLEKPVENFLKNSSLDFPFCICWANEHWTKVWASQGDNVLIASKYGTKEDWKEHFFYLLPFFKDKRYISNNNKPLVVIHRPELIPCLEEMLKVWTALAVEVGFAGIDFAYQGIELDLNPDRRNELFKYSIEYQPIYANYLGTRWKQNKIWKAIRAIKLAIEKKKNYILRLDRFVKSPIKQYDDVWKQILREVPFSEKSIPGAFVDWDNTARRGNKGSVINGAHPDKFREYFSQQIKRCKTVYKKDMIFVFAWNEWAECGYLEPDKKFGYQYLEALKAALEENNEMPLSKLNNK